MSLFRAKIVCVSQLELSHHDHDQIHHWLFQVHWQVQLEDFNLKEEALQGFVGKIRYRGKRTATHNL